MSADVTGSSTDDPVLRDLLTRSRDLGFLGPGPVEAHVAHAEGFSRALDGAGVAADAVVVDLGAGGGIPGLVLLRCRPSGRVVLVESMGRRASFLRTAIEALDPARAEVVEARAEVVGRGSRRGIADAVVARSFGIPAVTAECAAPLLRVGGVLVVSEPPVAVDRWPASELARLGLAPAGASDVPFHYRWHRQVAPCPPSYPRPPGRPAKRPLF